MRNFRLADCVTIMNGVCGSLSIFNSGKYMLTGNRNYLWIALWTPLFGMMFDLFDGKIARWRNESSMLGQELDSLADSISFGVAPAFLGFTIGLRSTLDIFILTTFICCGIARLARYNATVALIPKDKTGKSQYFEGLPIPTSLVLVGCMAACVKLNLIDGPPFSSSSLSSNLHYASASNTAASTMARGIPWGRIDALVDTPFECHWISLVFLLWAAFMISKTLHIPKP